MIILLEDSMLCNLFMENYQRNLYYFNFLYLKNYEDLELKKLF